MRMPNPMPLIPRPLRRKTYTLHHALVVGLVIIVVGCGLIAGLFSLPAILADQVSRIGTTPNGELAAFPVTVDPERKVIIEDPEVNAYLDGPHSPLQAAAITSGGALSQVLAWIATAIAATPAYEAVAATNARFVTIEPGMRKEQVASAFGSVLGWSASEKKAFETAQRFSTLPLPEGSFSPGIYLVEPDTTPVQAQALVNERFSNEILKRYGKDTAAVVPLNDALTVASLIEREAGGPDDMRLISGIIWNRLFSGMRLQIDATLQYVKAEKPSTKTWWPPVATTDKFIKSPYNTYLNEGLPPGPIANPSVAAVIAALNPKQTDCMYYFHDKFSGIHCSVTYEEHVALLKKYYGRGK